MNYKLGEEIFFDSDNKLFYCYIGVENKNKDLILTVWGKTQIECSKRGVEVYNLISKGWA